MIRIVIAEEQQMFLGAIGSLLNLEEDMEVVGQAGNGEEAIHFVHELHPNVCIMDIDMAGHCSLEAAKKLKNLDCKVIILTTFARNGYVQKALKAGVSGYLLKDSPSELLASSIRKVIAGDLIYEPLLMEEAIDEETPSVEQEMVSETNYLEQKKQIGTVKAYISTIVDKIKLPTA